MIVENKDGAIGSIGTGIAARAAPDGYTISLVTNGTHAANPSLFKNLSYRPLDDFEPVAMIGLSQDQAGRRAPGYRHRARRDE